MLRIAAHAALVVHCMQPFLCSEFEGLKLVMSGQCLLTLVCDNAADLLPLVDWMLGLGAAIFRARVNLPISVLFYHVFL